MARIAMVSIVLLFVIGLPDHNVNGKDIHQTVLKKFHKKDFGALDLLSREFDEKDKMISPFSMSLAATRALNDHPFPFLNMELNRKRRSAGIESMKDRVGEAGGAAAGSAAGQGASMAEEKDKVKEAGQGKGEEAMAQGKEKVMEGRGQAMGAADAAKGAGQAKAGEAKEKATSV